MSIASVGNGWTARVTDNRAGASTDQNAHDSVASLRSAFEQRLRAIAPHLLDEEREYSAYPVEQLLKDIASRCTQSEDLAPYWLFLVALSARFPTGEQLMTFRHTLAQVPSSRIFVTALEAALETASSSEFLSRTLRVESERLVVDADFCARRGHNTGMQRVVRETLRRWHPDHDLQIVAWTENGYVMRELTSDEHSRVIDWNSSKVRETSPALEIPDLQIIVPWRTTIFFPEVAAHRVGSQLSALAEFSGNRTVALGYDVIPVANAPYVMPAETEKFVSYLSAVKHMDRVVGISMSAAREFQGFRDTLTAQGLKGPRVSAVSLPIDLVPVHHRRNDPMREFADSTLPLVICVGTQEPRKNQTSILAAAESLWARNLRFNLLFIGGAAVPLSHPFDAGVRVLKHKGRSVAVNRSMSDDELASAYERAVCSVFVSLHEGFGLPVAESLAAGTPVIATKFGSIAEIAEGGGCLLVDPRDVTSIADALAAVLTDEPTRARLDREIAARVTRSWDDYSLDLWRVISAEHEEEGVRI